MEMNRKGLDPISGEVESANHAEESEERIERNSNNDASQPKRARTETENMQELVEAAKRKVKAADRTGVPIARREARINLAKAEFDHSEAQMMEFILEAKDELATAGEQLVEAKSEEAKSRLDAKLRIQDRIDILTEELNELRCSRIQYLLDLEAKLRRDFPHTEEQPSYAEFESFNELVMKHDIVLRTSLDHPEGQAFLLKEFNRPDMQWPVIQDSEGQFRIDLDLQDSLTNGGGLRPASKAIFESIQKGHKYIMQVAVSGSGKSSAYADLARDNFVLYFECTPSKVSALESRSRGNDDGFREMINSFHVKYGAFETNYVEAKRIFMVEVVCRMAQLYRAWKAKPDLTPREFYIHQKSAGDEWINRIRRRIRHISSDACAELMFSMRASMEHLFGVQRVLVIAIDEIVAASKICEGQFDSNRSKSSKGFLSPMISGLVTLRTVGKFVTVFSGTGLAFEREIRLTSSIGKDGDLVILKHIPRIFPAVSATAACAFFDKLNVGDVMDLHKIRDDVPFDPIWSVDVVKGNSTLAIEDVISYAVVGGRFRILTRILSELVNNDDDISKKERLRMAVLASLIRVRMDLANHFADIGLVTGDVAMARGADRMNEQLRLFRTSMMQNGGKIALLGGEGARHDLMRLELGNFGEDHFGNQRGMVAITEKLIPDAIQFYFEGRIVDTMTVEQQDAARLRMSEALERSRAEVARYTSKYG